MATVETTSSIEAPSKAIFEPFEWHRVPLGASSSVPAHVSADFAAEVQDVTRGVRTILQILERDAQEAELVDDDGGDVPALLSPLHAEHLRRLCIAALELLGDRAEQTVDRVETNARRGT